jgi:glycosyltransferase involved in cell wall biosynthesis
MIIELFGLPGAGKSSLARAWEQEGAVRIRALSRGELVAENILYALRQPLSCVRQLRWLLASAPPAARYTLFMNAFLVHNAKYERARRVSNRGTIALIDQGHFQNVLSIFGTAPTAGELEAYARTLPRPHLLVVLDVAKEERLRRLAQRSWQPREGASETERAQYADIAERNFLAIRERLADIVPVHILSAPAPLASIVLSDLTYLTAARMPTEKAHGISIAHMCAQFAGYTRVHLVVPNRKNESAEDLFAYFGLPAAFTFDRIAAPDLIGRGWNGPLSFFLQRALYLYALRKVPIAPGVLYTREAEIAWRYAGSHRTVFEAHRWPRGWRGVVQAFLLRHAALIVCNSRGTEEAARACGLTRTLVAPNGFERERFDHPISREAARKRLGIPANARVALYAGLLDAWKGVGTIYEAAPSLEGVLVVMIGGKPAEIESLSRKNPHVRFLGPRPYSELADNLAAADVLLLPNTRESDESARFTSPIKLFAYMAAGKPIVASDVPAVREVLSGKNAYLVPADDPAALAEGVLEALANTERSRAFAEQAKAEAAGFTWDARAERIFSALRSMVTSSNRS